MKTGEPLAQRQKARRLDKASENSGLEGAQTRGPQRSVMRQKSWSSPTLLPGPGGGQDPHWGLQGAVTLYPVPFSGHSWSSGGLLSLLGQPEASAQGLEQGCRGSGFPVGLFPA